jgi:hypothetical protein
MTEEEFAGDWANFGFSIMIELPIKPSAGLEHNPLAWFTRGAAGPAGMQAGWWSRPSIWLPAPEIEQWAKEMIGGNIRCFLDDDRQPYFRFRTDAAALAFKMRWL